MKRQDYFPIRLGDQVVWLRNFQTKLPGHAATLPLDAAIQAALLADTATAIYGLETYRGALGPATTSCYQCIDVALYGEETAGPVVWAGFAAPAGAPAAVNQGCLKRLFRAVANVIKTAPGYTVAVGIDLGIEGAASAAPDPATTTPEFTLRRTTGGKVEVLWTKREFDGVKLEFDLGTAGPLTDIDLRPDYTLNWLPPVGQSAIIRVRLRYIYKGEDFGNWSPWQNWTLTGE